MERKFVGRALGLAVAKCALATASTRADVFNLGGTQNADGSWNGVASLTTVAVENPGNATGPTTGYGSVSYTYNIGKYDVRAGQFAAFLNALAATDRRLALRRFTGNRNRHLSNRASLPMPSSNGLHGPLRAGTVERLPLDAPELPGPDQEWWSRYRPGDWRPFMLSWEQTRRLVQMMDKLLEHLALTTMCAEEIRAMAYAKLHGNQLSGDQSRAALFEGLFSLEQRPRADHTTLSVVWAGKQCYLGSTVLFRLADRLTRRPNHFATEADLLRDVWDGDKKTPSTIRSSIRYLKQRLQNAGMNDLAAAIQCEDGMYALLLGQ